MPSHRKLIIWVIAGNILDCYDFFLFAHLGVVVTAHFFPNLDGTQAHLLSLLIFAIPFAVRPLGGYFFGAISDRIGRGYALAETLKYASFASLGIALLPGYEIGGLFSTLLFIAFRALQGLSYGGEYTTAGTLLFEHYPTRRSLLSGLVGASGTVGSLTGFVVAWCYFQGYLGESAWRIAFGLGAVATFVSYVFRQRLKNDLSDGSLMPPIPILVPPRIAAYVTLCSGLLIGVMIWIPMVYVNFYWTKILDYSLNIGLRATCVALLASIVLTPLVGYLTDKYSRPEQVMLWGAILSMPLCIVGFMCIQQGWIFGQLFLIAAVALFGAPQHALINTLFPRNVRSRFVNTLFMLGASVGSLVPVISGYAVDHFGWHDAPMVLVCTVAMITVIVFYRLNQVFSTSP